MSDRGRIETSRQKSRLPPPDSLTLPRRLVTFQNTTGLPQEDSAGEGFVLEICPDTLRDEWSLRRVLPSLSVQSDR
jgi:hypothetical protein